MRSVKHFNCELVLNDVLQRGNGFVDAVRQRARPILAQRVDQLAENPGDMLVLGQISRPARVRQPDEDDALIFFAARAALLR